MEVYVNCLILIYTREQFEIEEDTEFERHWPRARASCIVDVNSGLILTSEFDTTKVTEVEMD